MGFIWIYDGHVLGMVAARVLKHCGDKKLVIYGLGISDGISDGDIMDMHGYVGFPSILGYPHLWIYSGPDLEMDDFGGITILGTFPYRYDIYTHIMGDILWGI